VVKHMTEKRYLRLTGLVDVASIRTAEFDDETHVVVPVIALVGDAVVRPMNAKGYELVPAERLAVAPKGWNGRPVVPDHPDGGTSSANEPSILESFAFGQMFNTVFEDGKLKTEAWLSPSRAEKVGQEAVDVISRCEAGELVEVSVGAYVSAEKQPGVHDGRRYEYVWRDIVPDHLAMLPEGAEGACSVEMGCGGPRLNRAAELRAAIKGDDMREPTMFSKLLSAMGFRRAQEGTSDSEIHSALWDALRAVEPGFDYIADVFQDDGTVIYVTIPEDTFLMFRRSFSVNDDGEVTISDDAEQVEPVTEYKPVAAESGDDGATDDPGNDPVTAAQGAGDEDDASDSDCPCNNTGEKNMTEKIRELVARLISNEASPFDSEDEETLEGFCEKKLEAMAASFEEDDDGDDEGVDDDAIDVDDDTDPKPKTEDEWMAEAPEPLRSMVLDYKAEEASRREALIESLSKAQTVISKEALETKSTEDLRALAELTEVETDAYIGRGVVPDDAANDPPRPYSIALNKGDDAAVEN